jgi:hypothetical protein
VVTVTPLANLTPSEYLEKYLPTWDKLDKVIFIQCLEETLEAFHLSHTYNHSDLYQRWLQRRYGVPSDVPFTNADWYELAITLLSLTHTIGR